MKKIVICLLFAMMLVSLSACANNPQEASEPPSSTDVSDTFISEPDIKESNDTNSPDGEIPNEKQMVKTNCILQFTIIRQAGIFFLNCRLH